MQNNVLIGIGIGISIALFILLRYLTSKHTRGYASKISQILNSEENKVKGQFGR